LKQKLGELEQRAGQLSDAIPLSDGTRYTAGPGERFEAFLALMDGRQHSLIDILPRLAPDAEQSLHELAALFAAFQGGRVDEAEEQEKCSR
jgi:hypothetical protein